MTSAFPSGWRWAPLLPFVLEVLLLLLLLVMTSAILIALVV